MKKSVFFLINVMFFLILSTPVFSADMDNCTIEKVGSYAGWENIDLNRSKNVIYLSHPTEWEGTRFFFLSTTLGNEGLATALTAVSLEKTVFIRTTSSNLEQGSIISIIIVNNQ